MSFEQYPHLKERLEFLCQTRRDEILQNMLDNDSKYNNLCNERTEASMLLREVLGDKYAFLEKYSNTIYAQECYELDAIYRQGILDTLDVLTKFELI